MAKRSRQAAIAESSSVRSKKPRRSTVPSRDTADAQIDQDIQSRITKEKKNNRTRAQFEDEAADEIDQFQYQRDRIALDPSSKKRGKADDDDDDDNDTEVLDLPSASEDEFDEGDFDESYDDDMYRPVRVPGADLSDGEDPAEQMRRREEQITSAWGTKKALYYNADVGDTEMLSDDEGLLAEEAEAERMRQQQLSGLTEADFSIADIMELAKEKTSTQSNQTATKKRSDELDFTLDDEDVERVERDVANISQSDKIRALKKSSPELFGLIDSLKMNFNELNRVDEILRTNLARGDFNHYLLCKHSLLSCLTNEQMFYLALKAEGVDAAQHPISVKMLQLTQLVQKLDSIPLHSFFEQQMQDIEDGTFDPAEFASLTDKSKAVAKSNAKNDEDDDAEQDDDEDADLDDLQDDEDDFEDASELSDFSELSFDGPTPISKPVKTKLRAGVMPTAADLFGAPAKKQVKPAAAPKSISFSAQDDDEDQDDMDMFGGLNVDEGEDEDDLEDPETAAFINELKSKQKKKQAVRAAKHETAKTNRPPPSLPTIPLLADGAKRAINRQIKKNEGLKAARPRDRKTPKTRNRARYDKAIIKRGSQVRTYTEKFNEGYGGEKTGIKSNVTKSVKIKN